MHFQVKANPSRRPSRVVPAKWFHFTSPLGRSEGHQSKRPAVAASKSSNQQPADKQLEPRADWMILVSAKLVGCQQARRKITSPDLGDLIAIPVAAASCWLVGL